jgi:hypothetical protein
VDEVFHVPYLSYEDIRHAADTFLRQYHASGTVPVPIEEIIEFQLQIDIVPLPGLEEAYHIVGFTSHDLREISIDEYVYAHQPGRYRFTLAHEVGHRVLHAPLYAVQQFRSTDEWKQFIQRVPELEYKWLEWQANCFAGLVLVTRQTLVQTCDRAIVRVKAQSGMPATDFAKDLVIEYVARHCAVSPEAIRVRLSYDRIDLAEHW